MAVVDLLPQLYPTGCEARVTDHLIEMVQRAGRARLEQRSPTMYSDALSRLSARSGRYGAVLRLAAGNRGFDGSGGR